MPVENYSTTRGIQFKPSANTQTKGSHNWSLFSSLLRTLLACLMVAGALRVPATVVAIAGPR